MKALVEALKAACAAAGLEAYFVDPVKYVDGKPVTPPMPYVLLWLGSGRPATEDSVAPSGVLEDDLGVTSVAGTPEGVLTVQGRARAVLAPYAAGVVVGGRLVTLSLYDSRPVQVDRDAAPTGTGRYPAYGVDLYDLSSVPAA